MVVRAHQKLRNEPNGKGGKRSCDVDVVLQRFVVT